MGVRGLTTFVQKHASLGEQKHWPFQTSGASPEPIDHFVFDGAAFVYHFAGIHNLHWTHGGQYFDFIDAIRQAISALQQAQLKLTFIFDGSLPANKLDTRKSRYGSYIDRSANVMTYLSDINKANKVVPFQKGPQYRGDLYLIPPMTTEACIAALRSMEGIHILHCTREADEQLAYYANLVNGYVVSQDSDFFVFPACGKGYIPLADLVLESAGPDPKIKAIVYHPSRLSSLLDLPSEELLPVIGTLLGNDYFSNRTILEAAVKAWAALKPGQQPRFGAIHFPRYLADILRHATAAVNAYQINRTDVLPYVMNSLLQQHLPASELSNLDSMLISIYTSIRNYSIHSPYV
ncbi:PIN domain-like protein, partial [Hesseltinella vesiculosa]